MRGLGRAERPHQGDSRQKEINCAAASVIITVLPYVCITYIPARMKTQEPVCSYSEVQMTDRPDPAPSTSVLEVKPPLASQGEHSLSRILSLASLHLQQRVTGTQAPRRDSLAASVPCAAEERTAHGNCPQGALE